MSEALYAWRPLKMMMRHTIMMIKKKILACLVIAFTTFSSPCFQQPNEGKDAPDEEIVTLISYNLFFLPHQQLGKILNKIAKYLKIDVSKYKLNTLYSNADNRAVIIGETIAPIGDIFTFQEVFDTKARNILINIMTCLGVTYATNTTSRSIIASGGKLANAGLLIMSKYPIKEQTILYYQDEFNGKPGIKALDSDKWADKGILYAKVIKNNLPLHIFTTHTQSKSTFNGKPEGIAIRKEQFIRFTEYIASKNIPLYEPIIIAGDFNVHRYKTPEEYAEMAKIFNALPLPIEGYRYSTNRTFNQNIVTFNSTHPIIQSLKQLDQIDFILMPTSHLLPTFATTIFDTRVIFSDHYPLESTLIYKNSNNPSKTSN